MKARIFLFYTSFKIMKRFLFGLAGKAGFEVVAIRLFFSHGIAEIDLPSIFGVADPGLSIYKIEFTADKQCWVLGKSVHPVLYMPVLNIGKPAPVGSDIILPLCISVDIRFQCVEIVVPVSLRSTVLSPDKIAVVIAVVYCPAATDRNCIFIAL